MGDCSSIARVLLLALKSQLDFISRPILVVGSVLMELAIGQYRLGMYGTLGLINPWHHSKKMS